MPPSAFDLALGLLARTLTCEEVGSELERQSDELAGPAGLVHFLRHFVVDGDIRERDPEYAKWQERELREMLAASGGQSK